MKYLVTYSAGILGAGLEQRAIVEAASPRDAKVAVQKMFIGPDGLVTGVVILSVEKMGTPPNGEKEERKMKKVLIGGYSAEEGTREFTILNREEVEEIISDLCIRDIYKDTFAKARDYDHVSGFAYTYLDLCTGETETTWLRQGITQHPWDSFNEIVLCSIDTEKRGIDLNTAEHLIAIGEEEELEFDEAGQDAETFILEKYGEEELENRIQNAIDFLASEFELDYESIDEQLDRIYKNAF